MKLGTHMPGGERRKPVDIEDPLSIGFLFSPSGICVPSFI
jgi:hypothetical protein